MIHVDIIKVNGKHVADIAKRIGWNFFIGDTQFSDYIGICQHSDNIHYNYVFISKQSWMYSDTMHIIYIYNYNYV